MARVRVPVSLDAESYAQLTETAREMKLSRSRVVVLALRNYLKRREGQRITEQLNAVYGEDYGLDEEDKAFLRAGLWHMRQILETEGDEW